MWLYILLGVVALLAIFALLVAKQPSTFNVTRSATMNAPPAAVFAQVNDFHKWLAWSPWERMDPQLQRTYAGAPAGEGATYSWAGNSKVGSGQMTITESRPHDLIRIKLEFFKPFKATNSGAFTFEPVGDQTKVVWSMTGESNFICKAFGMFMDMDKMIGDNYDQGLASMKSLVEGQLEPSLS